MKKNKFKIKNNVALNVTQTDKFKMSRLSIAFIYDADRVESPKKKLAFSTLMRGSKAYPTVIAINKALDDLYGSTVLYRYSSDGDRHVFTFVCEMLEEKYLPEDGKVDILSGTLDIMKDILFSPLLDVNGNLRDDYVQSEKNIAIDNIRAKINDQRAYSASKCKRKMFADAPCGIAIDGDEEIVSEFDTSSVSECVNGIYSNASVECSYIGSKDADEIKRLIEKFFDKMPNSNKDNSYGYERFVSNAKPTYTEEISSVTQGRLNIGLTAPTVLGDDDYYAMSVFNEIFGGSSTSKLFMNVREKKSLCYYCNSVYLVSKGAIFIACGINPENKDTALEEIFYQLEEMKKGNITPDEIATAKKLISGALRQVTDSTGAIDGFAFRRLMAGISESVEETLRKINAVTYDDIVRVANTVLPHTIYFLSPAENVEVESDE